MAWGRKETDAALPPAKKPGIVAGFAAIGDIVKQIENIDVAQIQRLAETTLAEWKRHNDLIARLVADIAELKAGFAKVDLMEGQLDALENLVRLTVPGANAQLVERDVMQAQFVQGKEPVQTGDQGNGVFTQLPEEHPAFRSLDEARSYMDKRGGNA